MVLVGRYGAVGSVVLPFACRHEQVPEYYHHCVPYPTDTASGPHR